MRVFVAGCFDVLTVGHFNLLMFARRIAGDAGEVILSIDTDAKIMKDKLRRPVFNRNDRYIALASIKGYGSKYNLIDSIWSHNDNIELMSLIKTANPDYIIVGSDYKNKNVIGSDIADVIYFNRDEKFSSTKIIEACRK